MGRQKVYHSAMISYHHRNEDGDSGDSVRTDEPTKRFVETRRDHVRRSIFGRRFADADADDVPID